MGAAIHRPDARCLRPMGAATPHTPQKTSGQIPCQHSPFGPRLSRWNETKPKKRTNKSLKPSSKFQIQLNPNPKKIEAYSVDPRRVQISQIMPVILSPPFRGLLPPQFHWAYSPIGLSGESSSHNHNHRVQDGHRVLLGDCITITRHTIDTISGSWPEVDTRPEADTRPDADTKSSQRSRRENIVTQSTEGGCHHLVDQGGLSSPSPQKIVNKSTKGSCRHQVDRKGIVVTKSTGRGIVVTKSTRDRQQFDPKGVVVTKLTGRGLSSPSWQKVVTQSTNGVAITKSARGDVVTKSTRGRHTVDRRSGDTKSTQERGHQVSPRAGTPSQPKEWGNQVNPRSRDTKSTQGAGTPRQHKEKSQGISTDRLKEVDYEGNAGLITCGMQKRQDEDAQLSIDTREEKH